jgi:uncharacterized protein
MSRTKSNTLASIEALARNHSRDHDHAHDTLHLQRVVGNARWLAQQERAGGESVDQYILEAACWLHDLVQLPKGSGAPGESARRSAEMARQELHSLDIPPGTVDRICAAIAEHSFSGGRSPSSIESAILQDADRIDALGAVGIARLWIVAATLDACMYHPGDPAAADRPPNDREFALDHIRVKLVRLPALMNTAAGRQLADERCAFALHYLDQFAREVQPIEEPRP